MAFFAKARKKPDAASADADLGSVTLGDGQIVAIAARIDCLGDSCPRPQLMTRKALNNAAPQDVIEILIDNPSSMEAIPPMMPELNATHL